jgi:hypothetical protein
MQALRRNSSLVPTHGNVPRSWYDSFNFPCVSIARTLYSAIESTESEVTRQVPFFLNASQFDTLRFRYRGTIRGEREGVGKSLIDVSYVQPSDYQLTGNAHRPLIPFCPSPWNQYDQLPIGIHHYLGSWESYSYRDDARKGTLHTWEAWEDRGARRLGGPDDEIRPWIGGFVDMVGEKEAARLLQDAGLPPDYRMSQNMTAEWTAKRGSEYHPSAESQQKPRKRRRMMRRR